MSTGKTILIVDDDDDVAEMLREQLEREGYFCHCVSSGERALTSVRQHRPDLILLDRMLPGMHGDEVVRRLKADPRSQAIPIIMLTGKADESDELVALALGADDYLGKPFSFKRLAARIAALLRRTDSAAEHDEGLIVKSIALDRSQAQVLVDQTPVQLTAIEYKLLATLIAARGQVLDERQLRAAVHGDDAPQDAHPIDGPIASLRRKMGPAAACIQPVSDAGYAFCGPPSSRTPA